MSELLEKQADLLKKMFTSQGDVPIISCPECGNENVHLNGLPEFVESHDSYEAWEGRGDMVKIRLRGECEHKWEFCFGFHKGTLFPYIQNIEKDIVG